MRLGPRSWPFNGKHSIFLALLSPLRGHQKSLGTSDALFVEFGLPAWSLLQNPEPLIHELRLHLGYRVNVFDLATFDNLYLDYQDRPNTT